MKLLILLVVLSLFLSCDLKKEFRTIPEEYNSFLSTSFNETADLAFSEKEFWSQRLTPDSSGVGDLGPLAAAYSQLFDATGEIEYLKNAEKLYQKAMRFSAHNKDVFARALARIYISQHRFKDAQILLEESYIGISNKRETELVLFDVYMEIGDYEKADSMLGRLKNTTDFSYLIRLAKWSDYKGNLDAAIKYLLKAGTIAESRKSKRLMEWVYTNVGDYYVHQGNIQEAYRYYLKTLQLAPDNWYAKKRISWLVFAGEEDAAEANRILDAVMINHKAPDYFLLKAEMAEFNQDYKEIEMQTAQFILAAESPLYGAMYHTSLIPIYASFNPEKGLLLANQELENRPTPEIYALVAFAQLSTGNAELALDIIDAHVNGKTSEPASLYYSALVYKDNGAVDKVKSLKEELMSTYFEVGPVMMKQINAL